MAHSAYCIRHQTKSNYMPCDNTQQQSFVGSHTITFWKQPDKSLQSFSTTVEWNKSASKKAVDDTLLYTIARYMTTHDPTWRSIRVAAYTGAKLQTNPENLEEYDQGPSHSWFKTDTRGNRNDWCMVLTHGLGIENEDNQTDLWYNSCPGRIHGFFRFDTGGVPTPCLLQKESASSIRHRMLVDDTMYVVVQTSKDYLHWKTLEREFIVSFELGGLDDCTFIFPVSRIVNPLYVFPDLGQDTSKREPTYFASLPSRYWAYYIDYKVDEYLLPSYGGLSQKVDDSTE